MLSALVKQASDKVQVTGGTAQDGAGGTKSVGAIDGVTQTVTDVVTQTVTDVVTQTATDVVAEYVKMTGAGRARLVPVSYVVADVRTIGAEFSPACRLGAEIAVAEDARVPGYVVVCMRKRCIPWVAEAVEAKACSAEDVTVSTTGAEEQASARVSRHAASDAAQVVAAYLACHPRVEAVRYPGLKTDPSFSRATSQLVGGFGPYVDYMWKESPGEWHRFTATDEDARTQIINFERVG